MQREKKLSWNVVEHFEHNFLFDGFVGAEIQKAKFSSSFWKRPFFQCPSERSFARADNSDKVRESYICRFYLINFLDVLVNLNDLDIHKLTEI